MDFKLISIAVALAILALAAAIIAPVGVELAAVLTTEQAAERLARELQYYQQAAVALDTTYEFTFLRHDNCYLIKDLSGQYPDVEVVSLDAGVIWSHLTFDRVRYYPSGRASRNGNISLTHENWQGDVRIVIAPHSGRIRVQR